MRDAVPKNSKPNWAESTGKLPPQALAPAGPVVWQMRKLCTKAFAASAFG